MTASIIYHINESGNPMGIGFYTSLFGKLTLEEIGLYYFIALRQPPGPTTRSEIYKISKELPEDVDKIINSLIEKRCIKEEVVQ